MSEKKAPLVESILKYRILRSRRPFESGIVREKQNEAKVAERKVEVLLNSVDNGSFGDLVMIQSQYKTGRVWTGLDELAGKEEKEVWIRARVFSTRSKSNKICFLVLRHGFFTIQAVIFARDEKEKEMVKFAANIPKESVVDVFCKVVVPENTIQSELITLKNYELQVSRIYVVSAASTVLPFQILDASQPELPEPEKKENEKVSKEKSKDDAFVIVSQKTRLDNRWIDLRTPANHAIFRLQSAVTQYYRNFFLSKGFVEIHTPKITPGVSEGGAAVFRFNYFNNKACLAQSPQLFKQMAVLSDLFKVFEIGPVFRAENANTHRHLCEFVGLDFEMEIKEHYSELLAMLGELFVYIFQQIETNCKKELEAVNAQYKFEPLQYKKETLVIPFKQAIHMLREAGVETGDYEDFSTTNEKLLGKMVKAKYQTDFYIIDRYPITARPFYTMPCADDPNYSNSYDVFLRGEEITSGAQRVHNVELLQKRARECGIPDDNIAAYVESFKYGAFPHGGAGIGLERVVMLYLGLDNIRKTSLFPRDPHRCEP